MTKASVSILALAMAVGCSKPKPPEVTPRSVRVVALQPLGAELEVVLDVRNPNGFAISASDVRATFKLESGAELGRGTAPTRFTVPAEQTTTVPARLTIAWTNLAALAPYALSGQPLPYRIVGSARIGGERLNMELPFDIGGTLTREQIMQAGLRGAGALFPAAPR